MIDQDVRNFYECCFMKVEHALQYVHEGINVHHLFSYMGSEVGVVVSNNVEWGSVWVQRSTCCLHLCKVTF